MIATTGMDAKKNNSKTDADAASSSPLLTWWLDNRYEVNEICMAAAGTVGRAYDHRLLLSAAVRGEVPIDDHRLRGVVGRLIRLSPDALIAIQAHREWVKAIGGAR